MNLQLVNAYESANWSLLAEKIAKTLPGWSKRLAAGAKEIRLPLKEHRALGDVYRAWLVFDELPAEDWQHPVS